MGAHRATFFVCSLFACVILSPLLVTATTDKSELKCEELGFTGLALCSDCDSLAEYVKDAELEADCRRCCAAESDLTVTVFTSATLEVCMRRVQFYSQIQSFIRDRAEAFEGLAVKYRANSPPKLVMRNAAGDVKETIRIDNWKQEHIESFLKEKLHPVKSA